MVTEKQLLATESKSSHDLEFSKRELQKLQTQLDNLIRDIERYIDSDKKLSKEVFEKLKNLINQITSSQERYATNFGKNESMKSELRKKKRKN